MRLLIVLLPIIGLSTSIPQRNYYLEQNDRPAPGNLQAYVKFSPTDIRNLKTKGYALPVATASPTTLTTAYRSTAAPYVDSNPSPTQRRPAYDDDENYPQLNSIVQQRQQQSKRLGQKQQLEEVCYMDTIK